MGLTREEKLKARLAIHDAVESNDWVEARRLGKYLEDNATVTVREQYIEDYEFYEDTLSVASFYSKVVLCFNNSGVIGKIGTIDDVANFLDCNRITVERNLKTDKVINGYHMKIIAIVPREFVNARISLWNSDGLYITTDKYINVCTRFNVHLEDLCELLYEPELNLKDWRGWLYRELIPMSKEKEIKESELLNYEN